MTSDSIGSADNALISGWYRDHTWQDRLDFGADQRLAQGLSEDVKKGKLCMYAYAALQQAKESAHGSKDVTESQSLPLLVLFTHVRVIMVNSNIGLLRSERHESMEA